MPLHLQTLQISFHPSKSLSIMASFPFSDEGQNRWNSEKQPSLPRAKIGERGFWAGHAEQRELPTQIEHKWQEQWGQRQGERVVDDEWHYGFIKMTGCQGIQSYNSSKTLSKDMQTQEVFILLVHLRAINRLWKPKYMVMMRKYRPC